MYAYVKLLSTIFMQASVDWIQSMRMFAFPWNFIDKPQNANFLATARPLQSRN